MTGIGYGDSGCNQSGDVTLNYYNDGLRSSMVDATGTSSYSYDSLGRLTKLVNGASQEVDYGYNFRDLITSLTYPGNHVVSRGYTDNGLLSSVADWVTPSSPSTFAYDADRNLCFLTYPNGVVGEEAYDRADRVTGMVYSSGGASACGQTATGATLLNLAYSRDAAGQLTAAGSTNFGYDSAERLQTAGTNTYSFDSADRITAWNTSSGSYDPADQLTGVGTAQYGYDSGGNRTSFSINNRTWSYSYDQLNRLTKYSLPPPGNVFCGESWVGNYTYSLNGDGLRMSRTINYSGPGCGNPPPPPVSNNFVWDTAEGLPLLLGDGTNNYVTGPGGLPIEQVASSASFYLLDQLGSVRALTSSAGTVTGSWTYDAWGNNGPGANAFGFAGQYADDAGFYYLRAREYDPGTSQFTSRDPATPNTREPYVYVRDRPLNITDPSGLAFCFSMGYQPGRGWGRPPNPDPKIPRGANSCDFPPTSKPPVIVETPTGPKLVPQSGDETSPFGPSAAKSRWLRLLALAVLAGLAFLAILGISLEKLIWEGRANAIEDDRVAACTGAPGLLAASPDT